ncbi:MAG: hypothetical protein KDB08_03215 [Microthrixaceae bacterium]|nr:hypothetical protein [Microthrixaceae bacterium]
MRTIKTHPGTSPASLRSTSPHAVRSVWSFVVVVVRNILNMSVPFWARGPVDASRA